MSLVKDGIPYEIAMTLSDEERKSYMIIFGELAGFEFDYEKRRFYKKDPQDG